MRVKRGRDGKGNWTRCLIHTARGLPKEVRNVMCDPYVIGRERKSSTAPISQPSGVRVYRSRAWILGLPSTPRWWKLAFVASHTPPLHSLGTTYYGAKEQGGKATTGYSPTPGRSSDNQSRSRVGRGGRTTDCFLSKGSTANKAEAETGLSCPRLHIACDYQ
jgi:hypothetical protein